MQELVEQIDDLEDFVYLKYDWLSTSPLVKAKSEHQHELLLSTMQRKNKRDMAYAFNVVMTALEVQGGYARPIRIVTDQQVYGGKYKRSTTYTREVQKALMWLIDEGYLQQTDGRRILTKGNQNIYLPNEYRLSDKWLTDIAREPMSKPNEIQRNPLAGYVVVRRDKRKVEGRSVEIPIEEFNAPDEKALILDTTNALNAYDKLMKSTKLALDGDLLRPQRCSYTRIFSNDGMVDGGRLYAPIQSLRSSERIRLRINDEPVVEIDYRAFHPTMLYELEGLEVPPNAYEFDGIERKTAKVAFNVLINRDSTKHKASEAQSIAKNTGLTLEEAQVLRDAIYVRHEPIKHRFNTGYGLKLQRIDSDIALEAIKHYTASGIPVITVHDSVVVSYKEAPDVEFFLYETYKHLMDMLVVGKSMDVVDADTGNLVRAPYSTSGGGIEVDDSGLNDCQKAELEDLYERYHHPEDYQ